MKDIKYADILEFWVCDFILFLMKEKKDKNFFEF